MEEPNSNTNDEGVELIIEGINISEYDESDILGREEAEKMIEDGGDSQSEGDSL